MSTVEDRHDGAEPPSAPPTPPVWVLLPGQQQEIIGLLHSRFQTRAGDWYYSVEISAWTLTRLPDRDVAEPVPVRFDAPASHVTPFPDTSYEGVPLTRHPEAVRRRSARRPPSAPASGPDPPQEHPWQLHTLPGDPPRRSVHHADCWLSASGNLLTTAEAREAAARPDVAADCSVCRVDQRLTAAP